MWALGDGKLIALQNGEWKDFGAAHGLPNDELYTFYFDRKGNLWTAARKKVFVLKKGEPAFALFPMPSFAIVDFVETPDNQLWVSDAWHSVHPLGLGGARNEIKTWGLARLAVESSGTIWLAQDYRGVSHFSASDPADVVKESAISEQTEAILRDRDGNLWIGSSLGLDRYQPSILQHIAGIRLEYYPSLAADPAGGVWVATHQHPLLHIASQDPKAVGQAVGSSPIVCDDKGHVWLVDPVRHDLVEYSPSGTSRTPNPKETDLTVAQSIALDLDGSPLVDFLRKGLWRYDGAWHRVSDPAIPANDVLAMLRDTEGHVWFGFADGRIVMRDASGFHALPVDHADDIGNVLAFSYSQGRIWAGGTDGVAYYDGRSFHKIHLRGSTALRGVSGIVEDKANNLWFNARAGIVRIEASEVQKSLAQSATPLASDVLDERQGLAGSATQLKPTPSAVAEKNGTLVFATDGNVFFLDPARVSFHRSAPKAMIETVSLNEAPVIDREHPLSQIKVNAGSLNSLEIDYVGMDLTSPEKVTYKYMLEGEDNGWLDGGNRGLAFYRRLRPGTYRFRIAAANGDEAVSQLAMPLLLIVTPAFYQTAWFYMLGLLLVLSLLYLAYLLRMRHVTNRLKERLRERSRERIRIARELHDTLLQSIHGLMLRFHFATEGLPQDEPARRSLRAALSQADEVIMEGRRRVQDLREEFADVADFGSQIAMIASEMEMQTVMEFSVTEIGDPRELRPEVQSELSKIAREALTNVLRHSGAKRAEIAVTYGGREFIVNCSDDGIGLEPSILTQGRRRGHWGLVGIRERTSTIQGKLQLVSSPGGGTEIKIRVPARAAYRDARTPLRWLQSLSHLRRDAYGNGQAD